MRVSLNLNLYKAPVSRQQNAAFKGNAETRTLPPSNPEFFYSKSGLRPATLLYEWKSPKARTQRSAQHTNETNKSGGGKKNEKVVHGKANPTKIKLSVSKPMTVAQALKTIKNPNDMQDYFVALYDARKKRAEREPGGRYYVGRDDVLSELVENIEYKVNKNRHPQKPDMVIGLDDREQVRLGALFAYWSTHYDGESRYRFRKPPYIRSTHELITSLVNGAPYAAPAEFQRFLQRLPSDVKKAEDLKKIRYEEILEAEEDEYYSLPWFKRLFEPLPERKLTFLEVEEAIVNAAYDEWEAEHKRKELERKNSAKTKMEVQASGSLL